MDIRATFPFRVFISLESRADRRERFLPRLAAADLDADWFKAVDADRLRGDTRGFLDVRKRSLALGKRLMLREAERRKAEAVLIFEDDAVFHPGFVAEIAALTLPDDWGIFYFGCQHIETPEAVAPGLFRVSRALDGHAFAIRRKYYAAVRASMRGCAKGTVGELHSDVLLSGLHGIIPTYAAYPNLAWQAVEQSDLTDTCYSNYFSDGSQCWFRHLLPPFCEDGNLTCL